MDSAAVMKRALCSVALFGLVFCTSSAALAVNLVPALPLPSVPNPYTDMSGPWTGTVSFSVTGLDSHSLTGTIDYGVYLAADFNAAFPLYPQPGEVVYAYQIFVDESTNLSDVSHLSLQFQVADPLVHDMGGVPSPDAPYTGFTGVVPTSLSHDLESADWFFNQVILPTEYSQVLVYSSPYLPTISGWTVQDGGLQYSESEWGNLLPIPGTMPAPEPATMTLLGLAGLFGAPWMVRRLRRS